MNAYEFADKHLGKYKVRGREIIPLYCPYCKGGEHRDKETFALNIENKTYNCKRGSCGVSGTLGSLLKDFGESPAGFELKAQPKKQYKKPQGTANPITSEIEEYLTTRGFSKSTWEKRRIGSDDSGNILMPYYEKGELVFVKYRPSRKVKKGERKSWREEGGKPVFWGMDECKPEYPLIIVEGEMDAMALDECGVKNVVSVPSGCGDLTCVENCWEFLESFKSIILWGDSDEPGQKMVRNLVNKLGEYRCQVVQCERKDANEVLYYDGREEVLHLIKEAKEVPINGILRLADVETFDFSKVTRISSGIAGLDKVVAGFMMGQVSIWTGVNSSGKSTLLGQILIESIERGYGVCAYSGELPASLFRYWIELQMAGPKHLDTKHDELMQGKTYSPSSSVQEKMRSWYRDKFFLHDSFGSTRDDDVLKVFEYAAKRYDCRVFMIDNLMTTSFDGKDFFRAQSEFVGKVVDFAHKFDVHVHMVAHPRKTNGMVNKMDIAGSGDITNRADNVFSVTRFKPGENEGEFEDCDACLDVLKNRFSGRQDIGIGLAFDPKSKRFAMPRDPRGFEREYGWHSLIRDSDFVQVQIESPWN
jgi:twinkle protein